MEELLPANACPYCGFRGKDENDMADHMAQQASDPTHAEIDDLDMSLDDIEKYVKESDWL